MVLELFICFNNANTKRCLHIYYIYVVAVQILPYIIMEWLPSDSGRNYLTNATEKINGTYLSRRIIQIATQTAIFSLH